MLNTWTQRIIVALAYIVWGSTFLVGKIALDYFGPATLVAYRFLAAGTVLLVFSLLRGVAPVSPRFWVTTVTIGLAQFLGYYYLTYLGMRSIPSHTAAVIASGYPALVLLGQAGLTGLRPSLRAMTGAMLGLLGVALAMGVAPSAVSGPGAGEVLLLMAAISIAAATLVWNRFARDEIGLLTGSTMFTGGVLAAVVALMTGESMRVPISVTAISGLCYLSAFGSVFVFLVWHKLVREQDVVGVSSYSFTIPLVATLLGVTLLDEPLTFDLIVGLGLVALGIWLMGGTRALANMNRTGS